METNPPANYPPLEAGHWETHPPPPGAANLAPPPNQYHPQYNQPYPPTHYNQPQPNYSNRPNAPAFNGAYWPDVRKRKFNHNPNRSPFESFAKLYIAQIPRTSTEEDIRSVFGQYGKIIEVVFIKDKRTGQQQGNCFVKYSTVGDAEVAIHALHNQYTYPGETESLKVKFADGEQERLGIHGLKLYVKNFNRQATKKEIEEIFSKYGEVEDVHILYDELRHSRGTGFVKFSNKYMAEAAINALNGIYFMRDCEHPLLVRFAEIKKSQNGDLRYKLPPTHGITGGQFFPRNVHQYQGPVINYGASVQTYPTNPPPRATLPDAHKQTLPTSPSVSHCGFHPQQQSSPMMPATCYPNKSLQESPHSSPQILEMPSKDNDPTLQLNEDQVTQHQRSEDQLISQLHSDNLSLVQRQNGDQSSLPQQNTDQGLPEQTSDTNSKPHKVDTASDVINVEPTAECMESTTLDVISSLDCDWSEHFSSDGNKYYYNSETCESRWEKPAEYASFEKHVLKLIQNETSYSASQSLSSQEVLSSH